MFFIYSPTNKNFSTRDFEEADHRFETVEDAREFIRDNEVKGDLRDFRLAMKNRADRKLYESKNYGQYNPYSIYKVLNEDGTEEDVFNVDYATYLLDEFSDFNLFVDFLFFTSTNVDENGDIVYWTPDGELHATYRKEDMEEFCKSRGISPEDIDQSDYEREDNSALMKILSDLHEEWMNELRDMSDL